MALGRRAWLVPLVAACLAGQGCNRLTQVRIDADPDNARVYVDGRYLGRGSAVLDGGYEYGFPRSYRVRIERQPYEPMETEIKTEPHYAMPAIWASTFTLLTILLIPGAIESRTATLAEKIGIPLFFLAMAPLPLAFNHRFKEAYAFDLETRQVAGQAVAELAKPAPGPRPKKPFSAFGKAYEAIKLRYPLSSGNRQLVEGAVTDLLTVASQSARVPDYLSRTGEQPLKLIDEIYDDLDLEKSEARWERALIQGMVKSLNDDDCRFLDSETFRFVREAQWLEQAGVGAEFASKGGRPVVLSVLEGQQAWQAGVRPGDLLVAIEGRTTEGMSLPEARARLGGFNGTSAKLRLQRSGKAPYEVSLQRSLFKPAPVATRSLSPEVAYLRLSTLRPASSVEECRKVLATLKKTKGLVLDLRGNSGGGLDSALGVARLLVKEGPLVSVLTKELNALSALGQHVLPPETRLAVLIDEGTSDGAEVLAAALRESRGAILVGADTFGTGSTQALVPLGDGTGLYLTTELYFAPDGSPLGAGLSPDITIERPAGWGKMGTRRADEPLQAAHDFLMGASPAEVQSRYERKPAL